MIMGSIPVNSLTMIDYSLYCVVYLPITRVFVTIWMVWYTGDSRKGVTPSWAITTLKVRLTLSLKAMMIRKLLV